MKMYKLLLIAVLCVIAAGCFSDYKEQGSFFLEEVITGLVRPDDGEPFPSDLLYTITLTDKSGSKIEYEKKAVNELPRYFAVDPGEWTIAIEVYEDDGETLYAKTSTPQIVEIKAGKNKVKEIRISLVQIDGSISFTYLQDTTFTFTPLDGEKTGTVVVTINWLKDADTADVVLSEPITGVSLSGNTGLGNGTHTITIIYNGGTVTTTANTAALALANYNSEIYTSISGSRPDIGITIYDGAAVARSIPLRQDNIIAFNDYANSTAGLSKHYKLEGNITLADIDWNPIGFANAIDRGSYLDVQNTSTPFIGTFDGDNNIITELTINRPDENFQGLFDYIGIGGTVKNLHLTEVNITGERQVGGIAGHNRGTIENCFVSGNITGRATVGGIAGHSDGTIRKSGKKGGTVITTGVNDTEQYTDAGGIVGYNDGTVSNCYNLGSVSSDAASGRNIGGVVGYNQKQNATTLARVEYCYNTGDVSGKAGYIGGIVGWNCGGETFNTVSLGVSVTGASTDIGRVIGSNTATSGNGTSGSNYARSDMTGAAWTAGASTKDGANITSANWTSPAWWKDTALFTDDWWNGKLPLSLLN